MIIIQQLTLRILYFEGKITNLLEKVVGDAIV